MNKNHSKNIYLIFLFIFAFIFNFYVANKGVLPVDTFLHYDSAARILDGIIPVRDYWAVHGITVDYFQALFFFIFGVNWSSYIFHSSILNALIHSSRLKTINWPFILVSPNQHSIHHETYSNHYSAPLINFDQIIKSFYTIKHLKD